jgi:hypothetical protein
MIVVLLIGGLGPILQWADVQRRAAELIMNFFVRNP